MKKIFVTILIMMSVQAIAQKQTYDTLRDTENGALVYKGAITLDGIYKEPAFDWMRKGADEYEPNSEDMKTIRHDLEKYKLVVFMGTWCEDSQNLIPKLYKILKEVNYPISNVILYGVDRAKTTGNGIEEKYKVLFVPSIILMDGDKETGRITESIDKSVEADMAKIMQKK